MQTVGFEYQRVFQELREHLTSYIRSCLKGETDTKTINFVVGSNGEGGTFSESPLGLRDNAEGSVLPDLLKDLPRLTSEESKAILSFFFFFEPQGDMS